MRREATSPKAPRPGARTLARLASASVAALLLLLAGALPAQGAVITDRPLLSTFDGSDTSAGALLRVGSIDVHQSSGTVYVFDEDRSVLDKFNAAGEAQDFSATGSSSLSLGFRPSDVAVDNSGANPGRIYVVTGGGTNNINAFSPAGEALWTISGLWAVADSVDAEGHLWVADNSPTPPGPPEIAEYAASGSPPARLGSFKLPYQIGDLHADAGGSLYVIGLQGGSGVDKYVVTGTGTLASGSKEVTSVTGTFEVGQAIFGNGIGAGTTVTAVGSGTLTLSQAATVSGSMVPLRSRTTIDPLFSRAVTVDQSSEAGHVFALHPQSFSEYDASGTLVGKFAEALIRAGGGIAYSKALDRVYVSDRRSNTVKVFGPPRTGTVPDLTIEAPDPVGYRDATFKGGVNPQGVPNSYFFEWKLGEGPEWSEAKTGPPSELGVNRSP